MNMKNESFNMAVLISIVCLTIVTANLLGQGIQIIQKTDGILVKEGDKHVLFYQKSTKSVDNQYGRANYIHPLYGLDGEVFTEDFPEDHLHHRGIFWAWHQTFIKEKEIGDGWSCKDFIWDVEDVEVENHDNYSLLKSKVFWKSPLWKSSNDELAPFVLEDVHIKIFQSDTLCRLIDFKITLNPLVEDVKIGGSNNEKGYGGFSVRIKLPEDILFTSEHKPVTPLDTAITAGPWMDFSASFGPDSSDRRSGMTILAHPQNPGFPEKWILRKTRSMQNPVYPGKEPVTLSMSAPPVLQYRLVVHRGDITSIDIDKIYQDYIRDK